MYIGTIMENQMESNMENEMETGIIGVCWSYIGIMEDKWKLVFRVILLSEGKPFAKEMTTWRTVFKGLELSG